MSNKTWIVSGRTGFDALKFTDAAVPAVGDKDVLVKSITSRHPNMTPLTHKQSTGHL